jgi:hypothetical protein
MSTPTAKMKASDSDQTAEVDSNPDGAGPNDQLVPAPQPYGSVGGGVVSGSGCGGESVASGGGGVAWGGVSASACGVEAGCGQFDPPRS